MNQCGCFHCSPLNMVCGLGAAIIALAMFLESRTMLEISFLIGIMLFVFDLFMRSRRFFRLEAAKKFLHS